MDAKFHQCVDVLSSAYDKRKQTRKMSLIVIHHTGTGDKVLSKLEKLKQRAYATAVAKYLGLQDKNFVSAHFTICREGLITQLLCPKTWVAFHAGASEWFDSIQKKVLSGCNNFSIGIELVGDGNKEPYTKEQIDALIELIKALQATIPSLSKDAIAGHQHIAPTRKVDPGKHFPWAELESRLGVKLKLKSQGRAV